MVPDNHLKRFVTFAGVGGSGFVLNLAVTYALTEYAHLWYLLSFVVATLVSWSFVFVVNSLVTFAGHVTDAHARRYGIFLIGYAGIFACNAALVYGLTSVLRFHYLVSITLVTAASTVATYAFSNRYVYYRSVHAPDDIGVSELGVGEEGQ